MAMDHGHSETRPWSRLAPLFKPELGDVRVIIIYALFVGILSLVLPVTIDALVTNVIFGVVIWPVIWLAVMLLGALSFAGIIRLAEMYIVEIMQRRLFVRVLMDFIHRAPRFQLEKLDHQYGPELMNRFFDVVNLQKAAATILLSGVEVVMIVFVGMVVLGFYHPILLAFDLGLIGSLIILILLGRNAVSASIVESHAKYDVANWLEEVARLPRLFKSGSGTDLALREAEHLANHYLDARQNRFRILFRQSLWATVIQVVANTLLLGLGGYLVIKGSLTPGQLIAAELIVALIVSSLLKLDKVLESIYGLLTAAEKLGAISDMPLERSDGEVLPTSELGMAIRVYVKNADGILDWQIQPRERIAIIGPSGTGKSNLLDRLAGFRDPDAGHIEYDNIDLRNLDLVSVRRQVAMVRGTEIFQGTVADNLRLGREDLSAKQLRVALEHVGLVDVINQLPEGINTRLQPTGIPLSEGQSLRLCIARAILGDPRLLIIDGILDPLEETEANQILDQLLDPKHHWTVLLGTRDPKLAAKCDRMVRLESKNPLRNPKLQAIANH
jgi:putative ABC transport system ATP-binding protein